MNRRALKIVLSVCFLVLTFSFGCEQRHAKPAEALTSCDITAYGAERIHIVGLTELLDDSEDMGTLRLTAFVDVLDCVNSRIKAPGIFRFELYEYVPRSSDSKGTRLFLWPDVDLNDVAVNNNHWREHLRAYEFGLSIDFDLPVQDRFVLEATFTTPAGRRLNDIYELEYPKQD